MFNDVNLQLGTQVHYVAANHVHTLAFVASVFDQQHVLLMAIVPNGKQTSAEIVFKKCAYDQTGNKLHTWHMPEDV
jgi:hypothetical protein